MNKKHGLYIAQSSWALPVFFLACFLFYPATSSYGIAPHGVQSTSRKIVAAIPADFPPTYSLDKNGIPVGFAVDVMNELAKRTGFTVEYVIGDAWDDIIIKILTGQADLTPSLAIDDQRREILSFTDSVEFLPINLVVVSGNHTIQQLSPGLLIGVIAGSAAENLLEQDQAIHLAVYSNLQTMLFELLAGHVDGVVTLTPSLMKLAIDAGVDDKIKVVGKPIIEAKRGIALRMGNDELLTQLNKTIKAFVDSPEYRRIYVKWYGKPNPYWTAGRIGAVFGILLLLTVCGMAFWRYRSTVLLNNSLTRSVTERNQTEQELIRAHEVLKTILERSPFGVAVIGRDRKIRWANHYVSALAGVEDATALVGKECGEYLCPASQNECPILDKHQVIDNSERILRCQDGQQIPILKSVMEIEMNGESVLLETFVDITERMHADQERENLQSQLLQAQKMDAVGRLAGGVAHDFNNMLSAIIGSAELAMMQCDPADPMYAKLVAIEKTAHRSAALTRQLLAFARKQTIAPIVLNLNSTISSMLKMLRRLIGENIDLVWIPGQDPWSVRIDPSQVDQLLVNLCVNARDAIAGVGRLTIETENAVCDKAYGANHPGFVPGEYVMLSVSDNGCGMDKDVLEHVFEPFFTTKEIGNGTGLGLSTVFGIVKQNNGFTYVYSEPGKGTTFKIYLRRFAGIAEPTISAEAVEMPTGNGETILLVEDDQMIMDIGREMLEALKYRVLVAGTPSSAIRMAETGAEEIHLILTDVVMPEMNGRDLTARIAGLRPGIKILFMSGYTADAIAHHGVLDQGVNFIQKPFSIKNLAAKVREVLDDAKFE